MKKQEGIFRDFCLLGLNHLDQNEVFNINPSYPDKIISAKRTAKAEIQKRLDYGKRVINRETKAGDLIMLETPEETTYKDFLKQYRGTRNESFWEILRYAENFYFELAKFAKKKGRRVESLESGMFVPGGKLTRLWTKGNYLEMHGGAYAMMYLIEPRRNRFFQARIQSHKLKLAIMHTVHAAYIENKMKPKKVIYKKPISGKEKEFFLRLSQETAKTHYYLKRKIRKKIAKEKNLRPKKVKIKF